METKDVYNQTMLQKARELRGSIEVSYISNNPTLMEITGSDIDVLNWLIEQAEAATKNKGE